MDVQLQLETPDGLTRRSVAATTSWSTLSLAIDEDAARARLRLITTNPFVPAETAPGSSDRRTLGVVLGTIQFVPQGSDPTTNPG